MAGYGELYIIGRSLGGFAMPVEGWARAEGSDGLNAPLFQIFVGDADRQWFEVHYFDKSLKPLGRITKIVPEYPNHPEVLLDCCIAFYPQQFEQCPSLSVVAEKVKGLRRLDFDAASDEVPTEWAQLREEARPFFKTMYIWHAPELQRIN